MSTGLSLNYNTNQQENTQLWKLNDNKANKKGQLKGVFFVKKSKPDEEGNVKGGEYFVNQKYTGNWEHNKKNGYGVLTTSKGNRYEGNFREDKKHGFGTFYRKVGKQMFKEYVGEYEENMRSGKGTLWMEDGSRYDGNWFENVMHGEGRMIYASGDIYEGQWYYGKKSGYGVLTRRNGDHYEGHWVNDLKEGQGSYFYAGKAKIFVGEWVEDQPQAGVYSGVTEDIRRETRQEHYTDADEAVQLPKLQLAHPEDVLQQALLDVKVDRTYYRINNIPLEDLFTLMEIENLQMSFQAVAGERDSVDMEGLLKLVSEYNRDGTSNFEDVKQLLTNLDVHNLNEIDFDVFARVLILLYEDYM